MAVADAAGRKLTFVRDYKGEVTALQTSSGLRYETLSFVCATMLLIPNNHSRYDLEMSTVGNLERFEPAAEGPGGRVTFRYSDWLFEYRAIENILL